MGVGVEDSAGTVADNVVAAFVGGTVVEIELASVGIVVDVANLVEIVQVVIVIVEVVDVVEIGLEAVVVAVEVYADATVAAAVVGGAVAVIDDEQATAQLPSTSSY